MTSPRIFDEFTKLQLTHTARYHKRRQKKGLCRRCGAPRVTRNYCETHAAEDAARVNAKYKKRNRIEDGDSKC